MIYFIPFFVEFLPLEDALDKAAGIPQHYELVFVAAPLAMDPASHRDFAGAFMHGFLDRDILSHKAPDIGNDIKMFLSGMAKNLRSPKAEIEEEKCIYSGKTAVIYGHRRYPFNRNGPSFSQPGKNGFFL